MNYITKFTKYITASVLGMIGLSCYILADTYFVSVGIGELGLAALNIAIPIFNLIISVGCHAFLILGANVGVSKDVWPFLPCTSLLG